MNRKRSLLQKGGRLGFPILAALMLLLATVLAMYNREQLAHADPIDPPEGYPKLTLSLKTVTPELAAVGGETLFYEIEIRNTGAYMAEDVSLVDPIPANTTYNGDAQASTGPAPTFSDGAVRWTGDVAFDSVVTISFSVDVDAGFAGTVQNEAVITHAMIDEPVTVTAETTVTDEPILAIAKTAVPAKPGAGKPLTYTLVVTNEGQPVNDLPVEVYDEVPANTTLRSVGADGVAGAGSVTWTRSVSLGLGETTVFTYSVDVGDVPSGTVITNDTYDVSNPGLGTTAGDVYTVTVVDPILSLSKEIWPDPPGSNRQMTYTLTLLNKGSQATDLQITDEIPNGVTYVNGGTKTGNTVSWDLASLDTGESAVFTFTVSIGDVADVSVVNDQYQACSAEGVCVSGEELASTVQGATFEANAVLDPIAKKPGGGGGPVTPTLTIHNLGPGNALDATAMLYFDRISVQKSDLIAIPPGGTFYDGPECGEKCVAYRWVGDVNHSETITLTTIEGQNTIGGDEGIIYTATVVITDSLNNVTTEPISATATGRVTHLANLIPMKSAPAVIGRGNLMTYTITVWNSGLSTDEPPLPVLTDTVPANTTLVSVSDDGTSQTVGGSTLVSWELPPMGPGDQETRSFTVRVDGDLVSGTLLLNEDYGTSWFEIEDSTIYSNTGDPVTTTVQEVGLIDSYKEVTPTLALPGPDNVLTYYLHIVNSSALPLSNVSVYDYLPWQDSTYQRDAVASAGQVISDIVSVEWTGSIDAYSSEVVTMSVQVDAGFKGAITNTAVISHPNLLESVVVDAVAYITDEPVLEIVKSAKPDPVEPGEELQYTIRVTNHGQQATGLVITDTVPANTTYVAGSASAGGQLVNGQVRWQWPVLGAGESHTFSFRVTVGTGKRVINEFYGVSSAEGVSDVGPPVITTIKRNIVYLPAIFKQ